MRSLQLPDILWIHWRVYNAIANTSKWVLFLPASDVCLRPLYFNKTLLHKSSEQSSLSLARIEFFSGGQEPRHLCVIKQQPFS